MRERTDKSFPNAYTTAMGKLERCMGQGARADAYDGGRKGVVF